MLEFPEVMTLAGQLGRAVAGKKVLRVLPPSKEHKFCWFNGDPAGYDAGIRGSGVLSARGFGLFAELSFDNGRRLCVNDGVNVRLVPEQKAPRPYQLMILFEDGDALVFTVAMYGGIILHDGDYGNEYYVKSAQALSPLSKEFEAYYWAMLADSSPALSAKAFLATKQRFPGIGNGVLQDILLTAGVHPKRKLAALSQEERERLLQSTVSVLRQMVGQGGRNTEKDLYGNPGGYPVRMCKNTLASGCARCGGEIRKEAYLGGAVYYCPRCQPLPEKQPVKAI